MSGEIGPFETETNGDSRSRFLRELPTKTQTQEVTSRPMSFEIRRLVCTVFAALACLLFSTGCCSFNRQWKAAATPTKPTSGIEGRWDGKWLSDVNGHTGRLRAIVSRTSDGEYSARYHATFWKVFTAGYTVRLKATDSGGEFKIAGEENLGWYAGGVYTYEGKVSATNFFSTYRCKYDHGTFQMSRPK
jgi:hypothetical protein